MTVPFAEEQPVKSDAVLFRIDPKQYEAALRSAEAQLAKAEADVELSKAQLGKVRQDIARYEPLTKQRAIPQEDLDEVLDSKRNVYAAELNLARARLNELSAAVQLYNALGGGWRQ
jgi:multidrug resistance efflux pump